YQALGIRPAAAVPRVRVRWAPRSPWSDLWLCVSIDPEEHQLRRSEHWARVGPRLDGRDVASDSEAEILGVPPRRGGNLGHAEGWNGRAEGRLHLSVAQN